jgi:predicted hydrocarbon binding protein
MTDQQTEAYHYPNKMGRIILLAMEEIIGRNGVNAVLNLKGLTKLINNYPPNNLDLKFPFEDLSAIQQGLEELYGPRGGRGLALRSGQACFKYGLREFGSVLGITDLGFRLLPLPTKLRVGADIFAETFNKFSDQRVRVEEDNDRLYWHIERCPICWGRRADRPVCHLAVGILQESLYWISGGKFFYVEEISCIAQGALTCTIIVNKEPLS